MLKLSLALATTGTFHHQNDQLTFELTICVVIAALDKSKLTIQKPNFGNEAANLAKQRGICSSLFYWPFYLPFLDAHRKDPMMNRNPFSFICSITILLLADFLEPTWQQSAELGKNWTGFSLKIFFKYRGSAKTLPKCARHLLCALQSQECGTNLSNGMPFL